MGLKLREWGFNAKHTMSKLRHLAKQMMCKLPLAMLRTGANAGIKADSIGGNPWIQWRTQKNKKRPSLWGQEPKAPKLCSEEKQRDMTIPDETQYNYRPGILPKADVYPFLVPKNLRFRHLRPKLTCQLPSTALPGFSGPFELPTKVRIWGAWCTYDICVIYIYGHPSMNHLALLSCACSPTNGIIKIHGKTATCNILCIFIVLRTHTLYVRRVHLSP